MIITKGDVSMATTREQLKKIVIQYLLEKIEKEEPNLAEKVAANFQLSKKTIYSYIKELNENNVIRKLGRQKYELVSNEYSFLCSRTDTDFNREEKLIERTVRAHIQNLPENIQKIWDYALGEMINNVIDHSECNHLSISLKQNAIRTMVMIQDDGVGIFKKIKEYFQYDDLSDAVDELFKGKLTTDSKNHSGEGIFFTSRIMDDFLILSSGKIFAHNKFNMDLLADIDSSNGTIVVMSIANNSVKNIREIFDRFADEDGGFTKTRIPVKNIYKSPVSRSEAKRLCARLDNFQTVELDFEGVDWIGQGFAHQIFVVFQNEHPELRLVPLNMNDDVRKMYNHVTI